MSARESIPENTLIKRNRNYIFKKKKKSDLCSRMDEKENTLIRERARSHTINGGSVSLAAFTG